MNKTVNINLAGIFFHIDEDAYLKLSRYLEAIKRSFTDSQGRSEIIADIEARIAELFTERIQNDKQVVGIKLVDDVITIMGQPEDYLVDDEIFEDEEPVYKKQKRSKSEPRKKLYRDTDNSYVGGVASGLAHYFGIDVLWIRLLWVVLIFGAGTGVIIYILLWVLVPEANTTAEKLTMTGEPVNISNIEKKIKDGFDAVSEKVKNVDFKKHGDTIKEGFENVADNISDTVKSVDFEKQSGRIKKTSRNFFETIGDVIMFFLKMFAKFFGLILIVISTVMLIGLIVAFFTVGVTNALHFPGVDFFEAANAANIPLWLMSFLLLLSVGIPFFFLFYLGLKILVNNLKSIGSIAKFTLLGLWVISILGLIIVGVRQATEHAYDSEVIEKSEINITANDTLRISMSDLKDYNARYNANVNGYKITEDDNGQSIVNSSIRLVVYSTTDSIAKVVISKEAKGSSYNVAKNRANNIQYKYDLKNNELLLNRYLKTGIENKFSEQEVKVIVYVPEGTTLYIDKNTWNYQRRFYNKYNSIIADAKTGQYLKVLKNDVECLDCPVEVKKNEEKSIVIKSGDSLKLKINTDDIESNDSRVKVTIDDESGVEIKTNNN